MKTKPTSQTTDFRNMLTVARGTFITERENDTVTFGVRDLHVWLPNLQREINLTLNAPDKFTVTAEDFETASSEFWARWKIFCSRAFKKSFIKIEKQ